MSLLSTENLVVTTPTGAHVLQRVSFSIGSGERVAVIGESGSGKSTLLRALMQVQKLQSGQVSGSLAKTQGVQWVPQDVGGALDPMMTVRQSLREPLEINGLEREAEVRIAEALQQVQLSTELLARHPRALSTGQRQRVVLARALVMKPQLLLLDEPTSHLDALTQKQLVDVFQALQHSGVATLLVTHDIELAAVLSTRLLVLYAGSIVEAGGTADLLSNPRHPYTEGLLAAHRPPHTSIQGEPPAPTSRPAGCAFNPRCALAKPRCRAEVPPLTGTEHQLACWERS